MSLQPWPRDALQHELRSIRKSLSSIQQTPREVQIKGEEGTFVRPMILITPVGSRNEQMGLEMFYVHRQLVITWFGSDLANVDDPHMEAWTAHDAFNELFCRGVDYGGPIIPIYDFSEDVPTQTEDWIEIEPTTTFSVRRDEYNLYTVPGDLRYNVPRSGIDIVTAPIAIDDPDGTGEAPPGQVDWPTVNKPIITTVNRVRI